MKEELQKLYDMVDEIETAMLTTRSSISPTGRLGFPTKAIRATAPRTILGWF
jgi:hypothetical protein